MAAAHAPSIVTTTIITTATFVRVAHVRALEARACVHVRACACCRVVFRPVKAHDQRLRIPGPTRPTTNTPEQEIFSAMMAVPVV